MCKKAHVHGVCLCSPTMLSLAPAQIHTYTAKPCLRQFRPNIAALISHRHRKQSIPSFAAEAFSEDFNKLPLNSPCQVSQAAAPPTKFCFTVQIFTMDTWERAWDWAITWSSILLAISRIWKAFLALWFTTELYRRAIKVAFFSSLVLLNLLWLHCHVT